MNEETTAVPLAEEIAHLEKITVVTGKVTVRTVVDHVAQLIETSLSGETVHVERVLVDQEVSAAPQVRTEGDVTIIPVLEERLVIEKRLVLVEEVRVTIRRTIENAELPIEVRKQRAVIDSTGNEI